MTDLNQVLKITTEKKLKNLQKKAKKEKWFFLIKKCRAF
jgi:hypothetical protein